MWILGRCLAAAALVGLGACADDTGSDVTDLEPLKVVAVSASDDQSGVMGTALSLPLAVTVRRGFEPEVGANVAWRASAGNVTATSVTDVSGRASAIWILGDVQGPMTASARVSGAEGSPVVFHATAIEGITAALVSGDNQHGRVGSSLLPLRIEVRANGKLRPGMTVSWHPTTGSMAPAVSVTDSNGIASGTWTLDTIAGEQTGHATISGSLNGPVTFAATADAGPAAAMRAEEGDHQTLPANYESFKGLAAAVTDRYGNPVARQAVRWTVESGPVALLSAAQATDSGGRTYAVVAPTGTPGTAVVRAALTGGLSATFALTVDVPGYLVRLTNYRFVSAQNGSTQPAVDTIPAGATMVWLLTPFDYDSHRIVSVGLPTFPSTPDFPYSGQSTVSVTFATPGKYRYADFYYPTITGIIVVK